MKDKPSIMTHIVAGYPTFADNRKLIDVMHRAGVKYIEIQIPFSDPIADGPVILNANQSSLNRGTTVKDCFDFAREMAGKYSGIHFLFMSYYNILFNYGVEKFVSDASRSGLYGLIVPDIPFDEDNGDYYKACRANGIKPVYVISPTTSTERLSLIGRYAEGLIYCTSRIGITGKAGDINKKLRTYVRKVRKTLDLPVAVGFGIDTPDKAQGIASYADIVVIGSKVLKILDENPVNYPETIFSFLNSVQKSISSA